MFCACGGALCADRNVGVGSVHSFAVVCVLFLRPIQYEIICMHLVSVCESLESVESVRFKLNIHIII